MDYKEALSLGQKAYGFVKCTYACLYDEDGKLLFSVPEEYVRSYDDITKTGDRAVEHSVRTNIIDDNGDARGIWKLPIVVANKYADPDVISRETDRIEDSKGRGSDKIEHGKGRVESGIKDNALKGLVPVLLTDEVKIVIEEKCANVKPVWRLQRRYVKHDKDHNINANHIDILKEQLGEPTKEQREQAAKRATEYYKEEWVWIDGEYKQNLMRLFDVLDNNDTVYVKPVAIDWLPDEMVYTFVDQEYELKDFDIAIEEAKSRVEKARRLLILACGAQII